VIPTSTESPGVGAGGQAVVDDTAKGTPLVTLFGLFHRHGGAPDAGSAPATIKIAPATPTTPKADRTRMQSLQPDPAMFGASVRRQVVGEVWGRVGRSWYRLPCNWDWAKKGGRRGNP